MTTTKTTQTNNNEQGVMTLPGHLRELRNRIGLCLVVFIVGFFVALAYSTQLVQLLTNMGTKYHYEFVYIAPQELMLVHFSVAMLAAFIVDIPVIVHQIYAFSSPAIENKKTRKVVLLVMLFGLLFFVAGVLFAYYISVPFMLYFLKEFGAGSDIIASISIQEYVMFLTTVFMIFGVIFEMPVISVLLSLVGVLKAKYLIKVRKPAIIIIFIVAAIVTPPDIVSQIMVAVPMVVLYELSIVLCRIFAKSDYKK